MGALAGSGPEVASRRGVEPLCQVAGHGVGHGDDPQRIARRKLFARLGQLGQHAEEPAQIPAHAEAGRVEGYELLDRIEGYPPVLAADQLEVHAHQIYVLDTTLDDLVEVQAVVMAGIEAEHQSVPVGHLVISGRVEVGLDAKLVCMSYGIDLRYNGCDVLHEYGVARLVHPLDYALQSLRTVLSLEFKCLDIILASSRKNLKIKVSAYNFTPSDGKRNFFSLFHNYIVLVYKNVMTVYKKTCASGRHRTPP